MSDVLYVDRVPGDTRPGSLILDTNNLVSQFLSDTQGIALTQAHVQEILTQIVEVMFNQYDDVSERFYTLPNFNRMVIHPAPSEHDIQRINQAVYRLSTGIWDAAKLLSAFDEQGCFPYIFNKFLGKDILLTLLPY